MKVLALIPARGGSKGVPRKNIRKLAGRPLLWYTAQAALESQLLFRVILSTEDEEIAEVGRNIGLDVPFMRPVELAQDDTPSLPVVTHALQELSREGQAYDAVCLLQPTNPLRRSEDIDASIQMLVSTDADTVISILPVPHEYNPKWVYWRDADGSMYIVTGDSEPVPRRQELPPCFHREGSVYLTRTENVLQRNSLYGDRIVGYEIPVERSSNIDTEKDWVDVERRIVPEAAPACV